MQKGIVFFPIIVIVLAVAVFGAVAYLAWQNTTSNVVTTNTNNNDAVLANSNTNVGADETSLNTNSVGEDATKDWKTYTNSQYGFSFQYPSDFSDFTKSTEASGGFRGTNLVYATNKDDGSMSVHIKDVKYDPDSIEGLYGTLHRQDTTSVKFGSRSGSMFLDGDAGCGGQEAVTNLDADKTLWVSFSDCEDVKPHTPLYNQKELITQILATFTFTK